MPEGLVSHFKASKLVILAAAGLAITLAGRGNAIYFTCADTRRSEQSPAAVVLHFVRPARSGGRANHALSGLTRG